MDSMIATSCISVSDHDDFVCVHSDASGGSHALPTIVALFNHQYLLLPVWEVATPFVSGFQEGIQMKVYSRGSGPP